MRIVEFRVLKSDLRQAEFHERAAPPLGAGEVRLSVEKFGFTANNITYAVTGDRIGYWGFFPTEAPFGVIPVWGYASVVESRNASLAAGDRLWGYWPMASQATLTPGALSGAWFDDVAAHRQRLPALYNRYYLTANDPPAMRRLEDRRCVLFPLFATSYILYDYLFDNDYFGARQILIGSASSKTGFGLAHLLKRQGGSRPEVVGLTSARNLDFANRLGAYDRVIAYEMATTLDRQTPSGFVDMSGDGSLIATLHRHFGDKMRVSSIVGVTHWEAGRLKEDLPGAKPTLFFAPAQVAKRDAEWGGGVLLRRAVEAFVEIADLTTAQLPIRKLVSREEVSAAYRELLDGAARPDSGLLMTIPSN
jgi:NADPH:quinone reductase-like Zn-dependent oxidoreductase